MQCRLYLVTYDLPEQNTGLAITLSRALHLPRIPVSEKSPLQITDTLTSVSFRGPEYIVPPGAEGVASLVFDVPKDAKTVRGGTFDGDETEARTTEAIFEVRCVVGIKMSMGLGWFVYHNAIFLHNSHLFPQQGHRFGFTCSNCTSSRTSGTSSYGSLPVCTNAPPSSSLS